jgi:cation diffusion facilitator family transporter
MPLRTNHPIHTARYDLGKRASVFGLWVNLLLGAGKLVAGVLGHSQALVADAVESLGDSFGSLIVWRGLHVASKPPDSDHPYGHGKAEPLAAALVALILFAAAVGIAVESVHQIVVPHQSPEPFTLAVVLAVVLVKEALYRRMARVSLETGSHAVRTDAWHQRSDAITSGAAAIGIAIALVGGPGYAAADDWAALFASGIILTTAWRLLKPAVGELMDSSVAPDLIEEIRRVAEARPEVHRVEKLLLRKMGLYYVADMHMEVDPQMTVRVSHGLAHDVKEDVQRHLPQVVEVTIHVEPAGEEARRTGGAP